MKIRGIGEETGEALFRRFRSLCETEIEEVTSDLVPARPDVCVCLATFNHGDYLRQCVESVLAQSFDGSVVLLIGDDCSTDGTRDWLRALQEKHPAQVRLFLAKRNLWNEVFPGSVIAWPLYHEAAKARYAALIEGDDYWIDDTKLQRQVDHLENHPDTAGCFTDCHLVDGGGATIEPRPFWNEPYEPRYTQRDCLATLRSSYGTGTLVFRGTVLEHGLPEYFWRAGSDFLLDLAVTEHGTLDYLPGETAAYRIHTGGSWQGTSRTPQHLQGLVRLRALEADVTLAGRFRADIAEARADLAERILNLRPYLAKGSKFPALTLEETPCLTSSGLFDFQQDSTESLDEWLRGIGSVSWRPWSLLLALRDGESVELLWWRPDGEIRRAHCGAEALLPDRNGIEWTLPDLSSFEDMSEWSGRRIPRGLPFSMIDSGKVLRAPLVDRLHELNQARTKLEKIENSPYWRFGVGLRKLVGKAGRPEPR